MVTPGGRLTCGLYPVQVRGNDDTLESPQLQMLPDLSQSTHVPSPGLGLHGVAVVLAVLESHQVTEQLLHTLIDILSLQVGAIPATGMAQNSQTAHQTHTQHIYSLNLLL